MINWFYLIAFALGGLAALAELLSRYSHGFKCLKFRESYFYLVFNGIAAVIAYWLMLTYKIDLGPWAQHPIGKVLSASLASMVILRSSVASIKNGDKTWDAGLAPIVQVFLNTADRAFDRSRSKSDIEEISEIMKNFDFNKGHKDLSTICINSMQNLSEEESRPVGSEIQQLAEDDGISSKAKAINLGIILSRLTGVELLKAAVSAFKEVVTKEDEGSEQVLTDQTKSEQQQKIRKLLDKFQTK